MDDLQTLGVDAVLLRGLEPGGGQAGGTTANSPSAGVLLDPRYGSLEDFDQLVNVAVRHGVRVLVGLRPGAEGAALTDDARFWLNRGVTGLALRGGDPAQIRALRGILRSYVGERILIAEPATSDGGTLLSDSDLLLRAQGNGHRSSAGTVARGDQADLVLVTLSPAEGSAAGIRRAIAEARSMLASHGPVPLLSAGESRRDSGSLRPLATVLLGSGGAVLLQAGDLDLQEAAAPAASSIFAWYRQWTGLHRGNPTMRAGDDTLLDHDAEGALVWVRQARGAIAPIVAICNMTDRPIHLSLTEDISRLRLRGSFLRTVSRSDGGMGAMPLRAVTLPPFGVYVGELSR